MNNPFIFHSYSMVPHLCWWNYHWSVGSHLDPFDDRLDLVRPWAIRRTAAFGTRTSWNHIRSCQFNSCHSSSVEEWHSPKSLETSVHKSHMSICIQVIPTIDSAQLQVPFRVSQHFGTWGAAALRRTPAWAARCAWARPWGRWIARLPQANRKIWKGAFYVGNGWVAGGFWDDY